MKFFWLSSPVLWCALASSVALAASGNIGMPFQDAGKPNGERMDRSWKRYRNADLGYCVSYPSKWSRGSAFDGYGLSLEAGLRRYSKPAGEIDIGPLELGGDIGTGEMSADARLKPVKLSNENPEQDVLEGDLEEHLAGLRRFARVERMEILDRHTLQVQGLKALYVKHQYYDPLERKKWMQEVLFVRHKGELFRLEMQCLPEHIQRFEPVFAYLVNTLEFDCK